MLRGKEAPVSGQRKAGVETAKRRERDRASGGRRRRHPSGGLALGEPPVSKTAGAGAGVGVERAGKAQNSAGVQGVCQLFLGPGR